MTPSATGISSSSSSICSRLKVAAAAAARRATISSSVAAVAAFQLSLKDADNDWHRPCQSTSPSRPAGRSHTGRGQVPAGAHGCARG